MPLPQPRTALEMVVVVCATAACNPEGPRLRSGPIPDADGDRVIYYDADVVEDDTDCMARIPYKYSKEELVVEWHTERDVTLYTRGGLYQTDVTLDEEGRYAYRGAGGPCLPTSHVSGRVDRQTADAVAVCHKRDCTVVITSHAVRRKPDAGVPPSAEDAGPGGDAGAPPEGPLPP